MNNCYWVTVFGVTRLSGNKLINGIMIGMSEMSSALSAGFVIKKVGAVFAFQILAVCGLILNTLLQLVFNDGGLLNYFILFLAMQGIGGVYTCVFVLIGEKVPVN